MKIHKDFLFVSFLQFTFCFNIFSMEQEPVWKNKFKEYAIENYRTRKIYLDRHQEENIYRNGYCIDFGNIENHIERKIFKRKLNKDEKIFLRETFAHFGFKFVEVNRKFCLIPIPFTKKVLAYLDSQFSHKTMEPVAIYAFIKKVPLQLRKECEEVIKKAIINVSEENEDEFYSSEEDEDYDEDDFLDEDKNIKAKSKYKEVKFITLPKKTAFGRNRCENATSSDILFLDKNKEVIHETDWFWRDPETHRSFLKAGNEVQTPIRKIVCWNGKISIEGDSFAKRRKIVNWEIEEEGIIKFELKTNKKLVTAAKYISALAATAATIAGGSYAVCKHLGII